MEDQNTKEQVESIKKELDEYEQSAVYIHEGIKHFRNVAYSLAEKRKRAVARVLEHILFDPLEEVQLFSKEEEKLVDICKAVMYHKGKLMEYAIQEHNKKEGNNGTKEEK